MTDMKVDHLKPNERVSESTGFFGDEVQRADPTPYVKIAYRFSGNKELKDLENPHAH